MLLNLILACLLIFGACTEGPQLRRPPESTIHFPSMMARENNIFLLGASSDDEEYHEARFVAFDLVKINNMLSSGQPSQPLDWRVPLRSNLLIPPGIGEIFFKDNLVVFASRKNSKLYAQVLEADQLSCHGPNININDCNKSANIQLEEDLNPFVISDLQNSPSQKIILVGYLSSSIIDILQIDYPTSSNIKITKIKRLDMLDIIKKKLTSSALKYARFAVRKIKLENSHVRILVQPHPDGLIILERDTDNDAALYLGQGPNSLNSIGSYLIKLPVNQVMANAEIASGDINLIDLKNLYNIDRAQDFHVDNTKQELYLLGRAPEALYKIDLADNSLIERHQVCRGATSMTADATGDNIYLPCYEDNRVAKLSTDPLRITKSSDISGRGPTHVIVDDTHNYVLCTYRDDGRVVIFNLDLVSQGYLFEKAPSNRVGSK